MRALSYFCSTGKHRRDIRRKRALSHGDLHFEGEEILLLIAQRASFQAVRVGARVAAVVGITMSSVVRKNKLESRSVCLSTFLPAHIRSVVCAERTIIIVDVFPNCRLLAPRVTSSVQQFKCFAGCIPYRPMRDSCNIICVQTEGLHANDM